MLLLAAKFGVPVCPHAGGVGLCEYVQHLAAVRLHRRQRRRWRIASWSTSITCTSTSSIRRVVRDGRYMPPTAPGYSVEMQPESLDEYEFPNGPAWLADRVGVEG